MSTCNMFLWRTSENFPRIIIKYSSLTILLESSHRFYETINLLFVSCQIQCNLPTMATYGNILAVVGRLLLLRLDLL